MPYLYVPGLEGSTSDSSLPTPEYAPWATLSGKPSQRPLSWRGWKTRPWIARLSGTTPRPLMAAGCAERWISSLADIRVSPFPLQASGSAPKTSATSGPSSLESFARFDPGSCSLKTSQATFGWDSTPSSPILPNSGSMRSGMCFRAQESVPLTAAAGSSFSRGEYPTPSATPYGSSQNEGQIPHKRPTNGTPSLESWAGTWSTPKGSEEDRGTDQKKQGGESPKQQVATWPTPTAGDSKASRNKTSGRKAGSSHHDGVTLTDAIGEHSTRPDQPGTGRTSRPRLNPVFVENLMAWPLGWTDCEPLGTEWTLWLQLMRGELSRIERG